MYYKRAKSSPRLPEPQNYQTTHLQSRAADGWFLIVVAPNIKYRFSKGLADKIAHTLEKKAEKTGEKPMMTTFSVYNLARNNSFDYSKAQTELGYHTRPYQETIHDEVEWLKAEGLI